MKMRWNFKYLSGKAFIRVYISGKVLQRKLKLTNETTQNK